MYKMGYKKVSSVYYAFTKSVDLKIKIKCLFSENLMYSVV